MILSPPLIITSRLMPGVRIGDGTISIGYGPRSADGRMIYAVWLDLPDGTEHEITDLRSGCGGGSIQDGLASLLSFLGAAVESRQYRERSGGTEIDPDGNETLFPPAVVDWATDNINEISMLAYELEEGPPLVAE